MGIAVDVFLIGITLSVVMWVVARHEADYELPKVMMVAVGLVIIKTLMFFGLLIQFDYNFILAALVTWVLMFGLRFGRFISFVISVGE